MYKIAQLLVKIFSFDYMVWYVSGNWQAGFIVCVEAQQHLLLLAANVYFPVIITHVFVSVVQGTLV